MPGILTNPAYGAGVVDPNGLQAAKGLDQVASVFQDLLTPALKQQAYLKQLNQNQGLAGQADDAANLARNLAVDPAQAARHNVYSGNPTAAVDGTAAAVIPTQGPSAPAVTNSLTLGGKYDKSPVGIAQDQNFQLVKQQQGAGQTPVPVIGPNGVPTFSSNLAVTTGTAPAGTQPVLGEGGAKGTIIQNSPLLPHLAPGAQVAPLSNDQRSLVGAPIFTSLTDPAQRHAAGIPDDVTAPAQQSNTGKVEFPGAGAAGIADSGQSTGVKAAVEQIGKSHDSILSGTIPQLDTLGRLQDLLNKGVINGTGSQFKAQLASVLDSAGFGDHTKLANTQEFLNGAAQDYARLAKSSFPGRVTNADLNMAKIMSGTNLDQTKDAIQSAIDTQRANALNTIARHNAFVSKVAGVAPGLDTIGKIYTIDPKSYASASPTTGAAADPYSPPAGTAPPSTPLDQARAAIAAGRDPELVKQRLRQNGVDPTGL